MQAQVPVEDDEVAPRETDDAMSEDRDAEVPVKPEPTDDEVAPPKPTRTPPHELHMYTVPELSKFKKKELLADVSWLEGTLNNMNLYKRRNYQTFIF